MTISRTRRLRRLSASTAGVIAAALALSGCLYAAIPVEGSQPTGPGPTAAPDVSGIDEDLIPFYSQVLEWSSCGGPFDCTTVTAPLDWQNPTQGEIELAVIRKQADSGQPQGSLLTNPGGPGASGVGFIRDSVSFAVGADLQDAFDVIGFDPRGVGESTAVQCFDPGDMDKYLFDIPANRRGTDAWRDELLAADKIFGQACEANSNGILKFINTEFAARDMDLLRAVLGDQKLNYLGYSYGTFLGATYAKLYPERVGRLVLDGAIDPSVSGADVSVTQAAGFESALRAYMADCLVTDGCPFAGTVDEAMADLGSLFQRVDSRPMVGSDGRKLGGDTMLTAIVTPLYSQESWPSLTSMLTATLEGDPNPGLQLADFYYDRVDGEYLDNSYEAFSAYNCMDYPDDSTPEQEKANDARIQKEAPTIAAYWDSPDGCSVWPYPPTGIREKIAAEGADPIVVVGTTNDPATPYQWSVALAEQLSSGVLVTRVGEGHTGYNKGNSCVDEAVENYLLDGTVPQDGLRCE